MPWRLSWGTEGINEASIARNPGEIRTGYIVCARVKRYRYTVLPDEMKNG